jgi:hypothetical protein
MIVPYDILRMKLHVVEVVPVVLVEPKQQQQISFFERVEFIRNQVVLCYE